MNRHDALIEKILDYGKKLRVYLIIRIQSTKGKYVVVNNGKTEEMSLNEMEGISFQAFTPRGGCGFSSSEKIDEETSLKMVKIAAEIAYKMEEQGDSLNREVFELSPIRDIRIANTEYSFDYLTLEEEERELAQLTQSIMNQYKNISIESFYRNVMDHWRIIRSDGTDITYNIPRAIISSTITAKGDRAATTRAALSGSDLSILINPKKKERFLKRAHQACQLAQNLLSAPKLEGGRYKIILDYALAKGLAHEAFGHAAESDGMKLSILGDASGRFDVGKQVASSVVSIIDESIPGDYAYQPYSPNGVLRKRVEIVKQGILKEALADVFSARDAGVSISGAGRVESYRHIPLPRMSNIRIEVENTIPMDKDIEDIDPKELYEVLQQEGYLQPEEEVLYLVGYKGGQVKPSQGEFVFNCSGIYKIGKTCTLYQPEIFSGKILSALQSIKGAVGPLLLDAQGTCGKAGQGVPSSGGSHYFIILDAHDDIIIGGK